MNNKLNAIAEMIKQIESNINDRERLIIQEKEHREKLLKNIYKLTFMLCISLLLTVFLLAIINVINLKIINDTTFPEWLEIILCFVMFMTSTFLGISIILHVFDKRILFLLIGYIPFYFIGSIMPVQYSLLGSTLMPILYCIIIGRIKKLLSLKNIFINSIVYTLFVSIYQQLSGRIKLDWFDLEQRNINAMTGLLYSIDLYIILLLIYMGVKHNVIQLVMEMVFHRRQDLQKDVGKSEQVASKLQLEYDALPSKKAKRKFLVLYWRYVLFQAFVIIAIGYFNNKFIEILIIMITYILSYIVVKTKWHAPPIVGLCSAVTFISFYILCSISPSIEISLFSCIILSVAFTYGSHEMYIYTEKAKSMKPKLLNIENILQEINIELNHNYFDLRTCTEEELRARCYELNWKDEKIEFAIAAFIKKLPPNELAKLRHIEYGSATKCKNRMKNDLKAPD